MAKHRHARAPKAVRIATIAGVTGTAVAAPMIGATSASAASVAVWDRVAMCESSGNWANHDTGHNGHYGGLQFSPSSWALAGGTKYAWRADYATKDQQIATAEVLLKMQGPGAWECAWAGPLTSGGPAADVHPDGGAAVKAAAVTAKPAPARQSPAPAPQSAAPQAGGSYTVRSGDTLSGIAASHHVSGGWQKLYQLNHNSISNPDLIFPGQHLNLG